MIQLIHDKPIDNNYIIYEVKASKRNGYHSSFNRRIRGKDNCIHYIGGLDMVDPKLCYCNKIDKAYSDYIESIKHNSVIPDTTEYLTLDGVSTKKLSIKPIDTSFIPPSVHSLMIIIEDVYDPKTNLIKFGAIVIPKSVKKLYIKTTKKVNNKWLKQLIYKSIVMHNDLQLFMDRHHYLTDDTKVFVSQKYSRLENRELSERFDLEYYDKVPFFEHVYTPKDIILDVETCKITEKYIITKTHTFNRIDFYRIKPKYLVVEGNSFIRLRGRPIFQIPNTVKCLAIDETALWSINSCCKSVRSQVEIPETVTHLFINGVGSTENKSVKIKNEKTKIYTNNLIVIQPSKSCKLEKWRSIVQKVLKD